MTRLVLRFATDDFDKPNHDIVVYEDTLSGEGIPRNSLVFREVLEVPSCGTRESWR